MFKGRLAGVGVGDYTVEDHQPLAHAVGDVVALTALLGDSFGGEALENPTEAEVRAFFKSLRGSLSADSPLVVMWSGHGVLPAAGGLRLLAKDSGTYADDGVGLTDVVLPSALSGANQLLFVFDTCFSGDAVSAADLATLIMRETQDASQVWVGVVTSCLTVETARDGLFGQRLRKVLELGPDMPELRVRWSVHNEYVRGDDVCDAVLKEWGRGGQSPVFRSTGSAWWMFRNPLYRPGAPEQVVEHLLRAARSGAELNERSWFTGRTEEVNTVVDWVQRRQPGLYVVSGSAGTGKSAILGRVVSLSNPEERERLLGDGHPRSHVLPEERSVSAHVHARGLTADLAADHLAGQLVQQGVLTAQDARRNASELVGEVQRAVEDGAEPPVLVVDGLDEARGKAFEIAEDLLTRLAAHAVVIVSTREMQRGDGQSSLVGTLAPGGPALSLDDPAVRQRGRSDLAKYVRLRLSEVDPRMDEAAVAAHLFGEDSAEVQHTFLLARLVADQLSAAPVDTSDEGWEERVSHSVEDALDTDLAAVVPATGRVVGEAPEPAVLAEIILRALTWAYGAGFPEEEWLSVANAEAPDGVEVTRDDISWVLDQLGRHIVQDGEGGTAVYRMAHQSLADHLRPAYRGSAEQPFNPRSVVVAQALLGTYRAHLEAGIPAEESVYLWLYGWRHAADAGPDGLGLLRGLTEESAALLPDVVMTATLVADRFQYWGRLAEALPPAEEAVTLSRAVANANRVYLPNLAGALNDLGTCYSDVGRRKEAVPPTEESVRLWRALTNENPAYLPNLAGALNNLGNRYSDVGRRDDALALTREAVRLWRTLANENPAYLPNLAGALNNLGIRYNSVGRRNDALAPSGEAVHLWRTLANENLAHLPDLAMALNNLGTRYSNVGRRNDALAPAEEALGLYRTLANENPAHLPDLAMTLNNLGTRYSDVGRRKDALPPTEEAVQLRRALANENRAYLPDLASALHNLGACYSDVGRRKDALPPTEEAVQLRRALANENRAYLPDLASTLNNLGACYGDVGRLNDALPPTEEAVQLRRALANENRAYLPGLASALNNLGACYSNIGRRNDALPPTEEAVDLYRTLADENRAYLPDLATALNILGTCYSNVGRRNDALSLTEEAVQLRRALANENRAYLPNLAGALNNLGIHYNSVGRLNDALPPTEEALGLYRTLAKENPAHLPNLAMTLNNLGTRYSNIGRRDDALPPTEEALGLYRTLAKENPAHLPDLAAVLDNIGTCYSNIGRRDDALPPTEEALDLYRTLAKENPAHLPNLATTLNNLGTRYSDAGRSAEQLWTNILSEATPYTAAFLLLSRSADAQPGDTSATAWLVRVEQLAAAAADPEFVSVLHAEGRRHRSANQAAFDSSWHQLAGTEPPAWLTVDLDLLTKAQTWVDTESYDAERDYLAAHPELLSPEADNGVAEAFLDIREDEADRYRDLRQQAQSEGVDAAYRPLLQSVLAYEFAAAAPTDQRALLEQRRDDLLGEIVWAALSDGADDPENAYLFVRAQSLLQLAQFHAQAHAFEALDDPSQFPALLHDSARQPNPAVLEATAYLALSAGADAPLAATAEFHLAIASAIDADHDRAEAALNSACDRTPENIRAWIDDLAEIAPHHPAALTLIPHLTARLSAAPPEEPYDTAPNTPN